MKAKTSEGVSSEAGPSSAGDDRTMADTTAKKDPEGVKGKDAVDGECKEVRVTIDFAAEASEEDKKDDEVKEKKDEEEAKKEAEEAKKDGEETKKNDEETKKDDEETKMAAELDRILDGLGDEDKMMLKVQ